jgi:hypothetical protein
MQCTLRHWMLPRIQQPHLLTSLPQTLVGIRTTSALSFLSTIRSQPPNALGSTSLLQNVGHAGVTRIPVAVEAFRAAASQGAKPGAWWAAGTLQGLLRDGSVVTSFRLGSPQATTAAIAGFQAKVKCPTLGLYANDHVHASSYHMS